jgi:hypothetical protein
MRNPGPSDAATVAGDFDLRNLRRDQPGVECVALKALGAAGHLLTKAAERLRRGDYYCRRLGVHLSWVADLGGWWDETDFHHRHCRNLDRQQRPLQQERRHHIGQ